MSVQSLCNELALSTAQCKLLGKEIDKYCGRPTKTDKRRSSAWQQCIAKERAGKKFDPQAIRELATEYKAGRCP